MKIFTKKNVVQKIVIVLLMVIMCNFTIPKPVQADVGGMLMSPIISFTTAIVDGIQHLLEWAMLGETADFMRDKNDPEIKHDGGTKVQTLAEDDVDGSFLGLDGVNIPVISYSPEEIFSNRVPALDINFINPSVSGDDERNIAVQLRPTIASWYIAIRTLAVVGLLSVLVYLGIRMLITSIAADKAKYKKMIMDWLVAMCLIFALHYIMSFILTLTETITAIISSDVHQTVSITWGSTTFSTNLIGYVRFMIQSVDFKEKITFFCLYLMLMIYSVRFTWVYLKRVVNMAFLTLIAPVVALTYPIDKVSDGSAQAFNMWLKEFIFNALIQPLHLLLYIVLLGSAAELAAVNPLYAIVCFAFIIAAEKLLKQMFGFNKASGGTLGSLAGAAGVTAVANKALMSMGKGPKGVQQGGGSNGKVRTKDIQRQGKDSGANSDFDAFNKGNATAIPAPVQAPRNDANNNSVPSPESNNNGVNGDQYEDYLDDINAYQAETGEPAEEGYNDAYYNQAQENFGPNADGSPNEELTKQQLEKIRMAEEAQEEENQDQEDPSLWDVVTGDARNFRQRGKDKFGNATQAIGTPEGRANIKNSLQSRASNGLKTLNRNAIAGWKSLPTVGYKAARGTLKTASRVALGAALGATAGVIGATNGNGEQAISMALGAAGVGVATGDNLFEATLGTKMRDKSISDTYQSAKYGNKIDARNAKADKEYFKSSEFNDYYEKYFKGKGKSKKEIKETFSDYRKTGITDNNEIRKAMKLEDNGYSRGEAQNILQTKGMIDPKAYTDDKVKAKELKRIERLLGNVPEENRKSIAGNIFRGYELYRDL